MGIIWLYGNFQVSKVNHLHTVPYAPLGDVVSEVPGNDLFENRV